MPTKITVIYDNPQDPTAFEAGYPDQLALARKIPGLQRVESSKVRSKEDPRRTAAPRRPTACWTCTSPTTRRPAKP